MLAKLLRLPAFLLAVYVMYWSSVIGAVTNHIQFWKLSGTRHDCWNWYAAARHPAPSDMLRKFFRIKVLKKGTQELYRGGPCLYMANHRSWADFFMDCYLTEGRAQLMSRMAVLIVFPVFMVCVHILRGVILFKRGAIRDKEKFNRWLDKQMEASCCDGILVFPEGHRSQLSTSLPLKRGMLHYAYSRQLPIQIVISANKEHIVDEKRMEVHYGSMIISSISEVIRPQDFSNFEAFYNKFETTWYAKWEEVYTAEPEGLPEWPTTNATRFEYAASMKYLLVVAMLAGFMIYGVTMWASYAALLRITSLAGPLGQKVVLCLLLLWVAASMVNAFSTHKSSLPSSKSRQDTSRTRRSGSANASAVVSEVSKAGTKQQRKLK